MVKTSRVSFSVGENDERNGRENLAACYLGPSIGNLIISVYVPNEFLIFHRNDVEISAAVVRPWSLLVNSSIACPPVLYDQSLLWMGKETRLFTEWKKTTISVM